MIRRSFGFRVVSVGAAGLISLSLAACGSDNPVTEPTTTDGGQETTKTSTLTGELAGAGASSQEVAINAWKSGFSLENPEVTVTYDAVGSGAGITQFLSKQVSFAGSDAVLEAEEIAEAKVRCNGDALNLPVYISPVAVIFNLPGIDSLNLDPDTLAKVFRGEISNWNDPAIAAINPGVDLPGNVTITPVHRSDKSGTTENFTDYLSKTSPEIWTDKADKTWPISGGESGDKTSGLLQVVESTEGAIGYADASQVRDLGSVALKAGDGFVKFSSEAAAKAVDVSPVAPTDVAGDLPIEIDRVPSDAGAYPLILISYTIVCSAYPAEEAELVKAFVGYEISQAGQNLAAEAAGSTPISADLSQKIQASLDSIKAG